MDAWSHMLFTFAIVLGLGYYPLEKLKGLLGIFVVFEIFHFWLAYSYQNPIYNPIGNWSRPFILGYLLFKRSLSENPVEQAQLERITIILFATTYSSGTSHAFDVMLHNSGYFIDLRDMWRGHNIWHTPFFGLIFSLIVTVLVFQIAKYVSRSGRPDFEPRSSFKALYIACFLGYFLHIIGDVITYDFKVFWLFPFNDFSFSGEDIVNKGVLTEEPRPDKPEGTVYYWAIPFFALLVTVITAFKFILDTDDVRVQFRGDQGNIAQ